MGKLETSVRNLQWLAMVSIMRCIVGFHDSGESLALCSTAGAGAAAPAGSEG